MPQPLGTLPKALDERAITTRLAAGIPALLAHPEAGWAAAGALPRPAPICLWFHGRTAFKELDAGRYLRWVRAGIAACAIDLPGHGERTLPGWEESAKTPAVLQQAAGEVDAIVRALAEARFHGGFDTNRLAIGGMSAGGMVALVRLCQAHNFRCAAVEATAGAFAALSSRWESQEQARELDPMLHLENWRPIPLLALHSEADQLVPFAAQRDFIEKLRRHYQDSGANPNLIKLQSWPETGAQQEHLGFGRYSNDAKNRQTMFLREHL